MRRTSARMLSLLLAIVLVLSTFSPALAATYRNGAQSGPSSSYKGGKYYANYLRVPITGDNRTDLVAIALSQLGYQEGAANGYFSGEVSGSANYVEFSYNMGDLGLGYGGSDYPWCASFVSWCLYQSRCTNQGTYSSLGRYHSGDYTYIWKEISCSQWVRQLKGAGYFKYSAYEGGSYTPKYGDLVYFQNSSGVAHIGICLYVSGGRIYTVEGNTSDASGLEANGGGVYFKNYSLSSSYLYGYGVLPYVSDSSVAKIDYSGSNPTPGLYVSNAAKYIYSTETGTSYSWVMDRFTMFEVTEVCSNGRLKVVTKERGGSTVTGYISNNSDRVIQLSSTGVSAAETAKKNLQAQITAAENTRHYNYTEAQITNLRAVYTTAVNVLNNSASTAEQMNTATTNLKNAMAVSGTNTIALNNEGIFINSRNDVIEAGDCFIYSNLWNNGLITVDNANIRYTVNVVCGWDSERLVNVVKSVTYGTGNSTPSIQLGEGEWLIAAHDWETGIAAGDNPVEYSGTNYKILSNLSVGDAVYLSGATALNANTYVEPAAYLKFVPVEATKITGENEHVGSGEAVIFTPDFNQGLLTHANANVHYTMNVLAQWDDAKSAWIVVDKFAGNGMADESSNIEIVDGQVLIAAHVGDNTATAYNFNMLSTAEIGQQVIFSGVSPTDGATNLSIAANVSFVDYVVEETPEETAPENLALGKDYIAKLPGTALHTAGLTDGVYIDELEFTGGWFGFACTGSNSNTDENGNGFVTIDLGKAYALEDLRMHLYAVADPTSIAPPMYVEALVSNNGTDFVSVGEMTLPDGSANTGWATMSEVGAAARYVRFRVGPSGNSTWVFLNEIEIYGSEISEEENIAIGTTVEGTPAEGYTGSLVNGVYDDWYGINTAEGAGSVVIDLGDRYKIADVLATVFADAADNGPESISVSISADGSNYMSVGDMVLTESASAVYTAEIADVSAVGRYVKLEAQDDDGLVLLSEVEIHGNTYDQSVASNVSLGKDYTASPFAGSGYTASLTDGVASNIFQYGVNNSSWFGFLNTGDAATGNTTNNRGIITIDLGGVAEFTGVSVHVFAGANDAGAVQPQYINVYYSTDGTLYDYAGYINPTADASEPYWMTLNCAEPLTARYVKLGVGTNVGDLVLLNEVQFYGTQLTSDEAAEAGSMSTTTLSGTFNNWNSTPNMQLTEEGDVTVTLALEAGVHEFKLLYANEWYGNNGTITDFADNWVMETNTNNCILNASYTGNYRFTLNRSTMELSVAYVPDALYLRGTFNDWGTVNAMTDNGDYTYTATATMAAGIHEFKIADASYNCQWPAENMILEVPNTAKVTVTLNIVTGEITVTQEACAHESHDTDGVCANCGQTVDHSYEAVVTEPTCTVAGFTTHTCSVCGGSYTDSIVTPLGHNFTGTLTTVPTCTESGLRTYTCSGCTDSYTEHVPATGHSYQAQVVAPTCTAQGHTVNTCVGCDSSYVDSYTAPVGHSFAHGVCTNCATQGRTIYLQNDAGWTDVYTYTWVTVTGVTTQHNGAWPGMIMTAVEGQTGLYAIEVSVEAVNIVFHDYDGNQTADLTIPAEQNLYNNATGDWSTYASYTEPTIQPLGPGLAFKDEIYYNIYFGVNNPDNVEIAEMGVMTWTSAIDGTVETAEYVCPGTEPYYTTYFKARTQPISAKNMGEELYIKIYLKLADGTYVYSSLLNYSAKTYAANKINDANSSAGLKALCVSLMNYGAAAQQYFGYKTDELMNADLTAEQLALVDGYADTMIPALVDAGAKDDGLAWTGGYSALAPSVNFGGALGINYTFTPNKTMDGEMKLYVWTEADLESSDALTLENASTVITMTAVGDGSYTGRYTGISAKNAGDTVYACGVYESNGEVCRTGVLAYSVAAYCKSYANNSNSSFQPMAATAAVYTYYANAYLGS